MMTLDGMTWGKWQGLSAAAKDQLRDTSDLTPQLVGIEGWRVEVLDDDGQKRRFIVGKSTGWRPVHLEIHNRRSRGGGPACKHYCTIAKIERVR